MRLSAPQALQSGVRTFSRSACEKRMYAEPACFGAFGSFFACEQQASVSRRQQRRHRERSYVEGIQSGCSRVLTACEEGLGWTGFFLPTSGVARVRHGGTELRRRYYERYLLLLATVGLARRCCLGFAFLRACAVGCTQRVRMHGHPHMQMHAHMRIYTPDAHTYMRARKPHRRLRSSPSFSS